MNAFDVAIGSVACLALWVRRTRPVLVALFATVASALFAMAAGAALVAIFNAAMRARTRALLAVVLLAVSASAIFPLANPTVAPILRQRFPGFMMTAIALGWGLFVRARRELIMSLRERAERLEAEQHQHVEQARDAERRRIAHEMHDVLAHRLSLLSLQAGALELRSDAAAEIVAQTTSIRTSAATALEELRDVIAVLRDDADATTRPPQPTLAQLPALLEESRSTGMNVQARIDVPHADSLPGALARTAYRVVQEGLTNARKHAPGATVQVTVSADPRTGLVVEVVSQGAARMPEGDSGRAGLIGLSERLALVGGRLEHGPGANGGFVLRASLPWSP
ncbi:MAG: sensor histidine kinase [Solirubrobacteraceae bacterium]